MDEVFDFVPERGVVVEVLLLVRVGGLGAGVGVAEGRHAGGKGGRERSLKLVMCLLGFDAVSQFGLKKWAR